MHWYKAYITATNRSIMIFFFIVYLNFFIISFFKTNKQSHTLGRYSYVPKMVKCDNILIILNKNNVKIKYNVKLPIKYFIKT